MAECRCCGAEVNESVHAFMKAVEDACIAVATERFKQHGQKPEVCDALEALVSVAANLIDGQFTGQPERRTKELKKCEQFFRDEYVN